MAHLGLPPQSAYIFDKKWIAVSESVYTAELYRQSVASGEMLTTKSRAALEAARKEMSIFQQTYSTSECLARFRMLRDRHRDFGAIISLPTVYYNAHDNVIMTDNATWAKIIRYEWGPAYAHCGEINWTQLVQIFGQPEINPVTTGVPVYNISSTEVETPDRDSHRRGSRINRTESLRNSTSDVPRARRPILQHHTESASDAYSNIAANNNIFGYVPDSSDSLHSTGRRHQVPDPYVGNYNAALNTPGSVSNWPENWPNYSGSNSESVNGNGESSNAHRNAGVETRYNFGPFGPPRRDF